MSLKTSYDQDLRAIGQALEARGINVFELKNHGDRYVVRGEPDRSSALLVSLRQWRERLAGRSGASGLSYTPRDIECLELEGRAKRSQPDRLPDFYSISNTLRTVGSYLDSKGARLLELQKTALTLMILYQNKDGHPNVEERSVASFYNLFIHLHGRRRKLTTH